MNRPNQIEQIAIDDLLPYARNSRTHSPEQIAQIAASMVEFGWTNPVLIDANGTIVAGHGRVLAARNLKMDSVPCIRLGHLTPSQVRAYVIADNKLALNAGWDEAMLKSELDAIKEEGFEIGLTGFSDDEIEALLNVEVVQGNTNPDEVPEAPKEPITKPGDLWILGNHRLLCGDSTNPQHVERLMDCKKADMVFTDPPYGIAYSSSKFDGNTKGLTNKRNKAKMIMGDESDYDPSFLLQLFKSSKEIFVWGYQYYPHKLGRGGIIVWNKKRKEEQDCPHGDFELCWSKNERNKMCWIRWGGFNNKENGEERLHTTQKPVALVEWFFDNWGKGSTIVADLFGGSGTTLIACEKTSRHCRMMELDPSYCDVIVKRWEEFTGRKAERK